MKEVWVEGKNAFGALWLTTNIILVKPNVQTSCDFNRMVEVPLYGESDEKSIDKRGGVSLVL
jgi:hypothetical protein